MGSTSYKCIGITWNRENKLDYVKINEKCNYINHVSSHFYNFFVILKYYRCLWANIFDTDIYRCINTYIKVVYWAFLGIFMLLQMSVSKILADRRLWYFKTTKNLQKWIQTWFILLHLVLVWNVHVKFTKRAIVYQWSFIPWQQTRMHRIKIKSK